MVRFAVDMPNRTVHILVPNDQSLFEVIHSVKVYLPGGMVPSEGISLEEGENHDFILWEGPRRNAFDLPKKKRVKLLQNMSREV